MAGVITPVGDVELALSMRPAPERWKLLKYRYNTPELLFRDLLSHHTAMATEFPSGITFDERELRIKSKMILRGYARNEGDGEWFVDLDLADDQAIKAFKRGEADDRATLAWTLQQEGDGVVFEITMAVTLPAGASNVRVDEKGGVFRYTLAHPPGSGRPRLEPRLELKERSLTGAYKVYAMQEAVPSHWLAKVAFKNTGSSVVRRLRVRCRVQGYSEWGLWAKFPEVVPGQTVVVPYHPVLDEKVAQLQDKTPTNVLVEWRYEDADGKAYEDTDGARATLMGGNEFYFTNYRVGEYTDNFYEIMTQNADLLAAWVSREDAAVDEFAAMANHIAGGAPSVYTPEAASATLHAIYELWVRNKFVYVSPAGLTDTSVSFDPRLVQNIKYPRDVIRDKAGTCIDLAILYAAMASALGLESYLCLVPGHCFPVFLLPPQKGETERRWLPIEATGIMGGLGPRVHSWVEVNQHGQAQLQKVFGGQMPGMLISIKELRQKGMAGPQLPVLPPDVLERWGIVEGSGPILTAGGGSQQPQPQPSRSSTLLTGRWVGRQVFQTPQGNIPASMEVTVQQAQGGAYTFEGSSLIDITMGGERVRIASTAAGNLIVNGSTIVFQILRGQTRNLITGAIENDSPYSVTLTLKGNTISGTTTSPEGFLVEIFLQKQGG
jgi:transglutaminase-like putative cysteine protease